MIRKISVLLVPVLLLIAGLLFGSSLLLRLFYVSVLVIGAGFLWTRLCLRRLSEETAKPPEHPQVGDSFKWQIDFKNSSRLPQLFLRSNFITDMPEVSERTVINIPERGYYTWEADVKCRHRGSYQLGPVTVAVTDPFGIFTRRVSLGGEQELTVYPATVDLPHFKSSSFSDYGPAAGHRSISNQGPDASSVRDFTSGDSLQHIHWPSTARSGKIMVKLFDADRSYNASKKSWVLLDMHEDSHCPGAGQSSDDFAVTIAASVIKKHLQGGMRVGLLAAGDKSYLIRPERGEEHQWRVLKTLALMQTGRTLPLDNLLTSQLPSFRDNPLMIIVVTSATRNLLETIQRLRERTDMVVVICLDIAGWSGVSLAANLSPAITQLGAQVYYVRRGEELAAALDSKVTHKHTVATG